ALVTGWRGGDRRLEHRLARGKDGRTHVVPRDPRAKRAVSEVRVIERAGSRALLEVRIETGRTHQIRAQLAAEGAPVVGDALYGGEPAPRLMLHASSIALAHPVRGTPLSVRAPIPPLFSRALRGRLDEPLEDALARAVERRFGLAHRDDLSAFRLLDEGDGIAGLAVDVYDDWLVAHLYSDAIEARLDEVLDALTRLGPRGVYLKRRPKQANVIVDPKDGTWAPALPVRGEPAPDPLAIRENGLAYLVRLGDGLSTGIFLDQRENRRRVRELAKGARVLNLFAYTCGFTVAAAAGGARESLSIDASASALARGRANLEHAGLASPAHAFEAADVFEALARLAKAGERFDLVIVDPPTYSTTRASRWTSGADWRALAAACLRVLARGGRMLACSNDRRLKQAKLRRYVHEAARDAGVEIAQLKDLPCPSDFPPPFGEEPHLKSLLLRAG
ncbi:MAG TPA: class I SAM-dependent methyltransferase, partial [Sandaracinaceae bacterium]